MQSKFYKNNLRKYVPPPAMKSIVLASPPSPPMKSIVLAFFFHEIQFSSIFLNRKYTYDQDNYNPLLPVCFQHPIYRYEIAFICWIYEFKQKR